MRDRMRPAPRGQQIPNIGLLTLAMATLLVMTLLGPILVYSELPLAGEGNPVRQAIYALVFIATIVGVRPSNALDRLIAVPIPIVVAFVWCWLSIFWSIDAGITFRRLVLTTLLVWAIFIAVRQLGYQRTLALLRAALAITLIVNFIAVLLFPDFGIHQVNTSDDDSLIGDWRGVMMHKNFAGATSALLIPLLVFDAKRIPLSIRLVGIALATVFLIFSQSKTSLGLIGFGVIAGAAYMRYGPRTRALMVPVLMILGVAGMLINNIYHNPLALVLRDPTAFTGRTVIWRALLNYANDHPLLGTGYGAFWNIGPKSPIYTYGEKWITTVTSGHNGFLDLVVQIGIPGLILVLIATVVWPLAVLFLNVRIAPARGALVIAMLIFCIAHNGTESSLFDRDVIVNIFMMFAIALIPLLSEDAKHARRDEDTPFAALGMRFSET